MTLYTDINAIRNNLKLIQSKLPQGTRLLFMVKCNAYGHGAETISKYTQDIVDFFGVATVEEGVELRHAGIEKPILVTGFDESESELAINHNLTVTVYNESQIETLAKIEKSVDVHIKLDTGMNRLGIKTLTELNSVMKCCLKHPNIKVKGAFSHLYSSKKTNIDLQNRRFLLMLGRIKQYYPDIIAHLKASSGVFVTDSYCYDMVRVGIAGYGYSPYNQFLQKAMYAVGKIKAVKHVMRGEVISYDGIYTAKKNMTIAIVSGGYGDGINRKQKNVIINGKICDIVGKICMDMFMAEVDESAKVGDNVYVMGAEGDAQIYANKIAHELDTIPYEVLTDYHNRIKRVYLL